MKRRLTLLLSIFIILSIVLPSSAMAATLGDGQYITSEGACVMDYNSGRVLYEHNGNVQRVPASMTKVMSLYCIYEALEKGEITLNTKVPISSTVHNKPYYQSDFRLYNNIHYTVNELMDVIVVYSANSAVIAMAELICGSEAAFVKRMNNTAKKMGIDAVYYDCYGIALNKISPLAMATLARNIIKDYPDILKRTSKKSVNFHGKTYYTTNHLLDTYYYEGADGLKTGTTTAAGYCFCGTAVKNGNRVISVTMASSSTNQRFIDCTRLLNYGFKRIEELYNTIYFTDRTAYINGTELPTFIYNGAETKQVIIAEDLKNYGFDVLWDSKENKLTLRYNKTKKMKPMAMSYYKNKNGTKAYSICKNNQTKVVLMDGIDEYQIKDVFNLNGYMAISIDSLSEIYNVEWVDNRADIIIPQVA